MVLPNQLTILRIILTPFFFILLLSDNLLSKQIALGIFLLAAITDWYDGWLARKFNYITNWGRIWDPLADKILTSSAFIAFVILGLIPLWMVLIILVRDIIITILRILSDYKSIVFPTSIYAKWKTFLQMVILYYILIVYVGSFSFKVFIGEIELFNLLLNENIIYFSMLLVTLITLHSGISYLINNRVLIRKVFTSEN